MTADLEWSTAASTTLVTSIWWDLESLDCEVYLWFSQLYIRRDLLPRLRPSFGRFISSYALSSPLCQSSLKRQPQDNSEQPPKWSKLFFPSDFLKIKLCLIAKQCIFILEEKKKKTLKISKKNPLWLLWSHRHICMHIYIHISVCVYILGLFVNFKNNCYSLKTYIFLTNSTQYISLYAPECLLLYTNVLA